MRTGILEQYETYDVEGHVPIREHMNSGLMSIVVLVTEECNLRCSYCYIAKEKLFMSEQTAVQTVDFLFDNCTIQDDKLNITFFGGEPLVNPKLIKFICEYANGKAKAEGKKMTYSMTTNGTLMSAKNFKLVKKYAIQTQLSLDGVKESHDLSRKTIAGKSSFDLIERNLDRLLALKCRVRLTVSPQTAETLTKSIDWILKTGFHSVSFSPVIEADWTPESLRHLLKSWRELYPLAKKYKTEKRPNPIVNLNGLREQIESGEIRKAGCGAARGMVAISSNGHVFPCHRYIGYFKGNTDVSIGHVASGFDTLRRAYYLESNFMQNKAGCGMGVYKDSVKNSDKNCETCRFAQNCGSACMAVNHYMNDDPTKPSPINRILSQIQISAEYNCGHGE